MRYSGGLWVAACGLLGVLGGCATAPASQVAAAPVLATVSNASGRVVSGVSYQACDGDSESWSALDVRPIPSGSRVSFPIPAACVNMQAYYSDGRVAGSQNGIRRDFPFTWVIR